MAAPALSSPSRVGVVHVHSDYSHDGRDPLERLREFALERGIGFVGLTDHAEDFSAEIFGRYVEHCARLSGAEVRLVPGLEFRFPGYPGLHLLALGLSRWIEPARPAEFISLTRGISEFTIVAHPLLADYQVPPEVRDGIDAIEVWNAAYNTRYLPDPRAVRLLLEIRARRPEVVGVAGLDQHDARNDRETRVRLDANWLGNPLPALRAGRFENLGRTMRFGPKPSWGPIRLGLLQALRSGLNLSNTGHEWFMNAWKRIYR